MSTDNDVKFKKHDAGKVRMSLIPPVAIKSVAEVFTHGALKYGDWNWRKGAGNVAVEYRLLDAIKRHLNMYEQGLLINDPTLKIDAEWGKSHLAHAACGLLMLLDFHEGALSVLTDGTAPRVGDDAADDDAYVAVVHSGVLRIWSRNSADIRGTVLKVGDTITHHSRLGHDYSGVIDRIGQHSVRFTDWHHVFEGARVTCNEV